MTPEQILQLRAAIAAMQGNQSVLQRRIWNPAKSLIQSTDLQQNLSRGGYQGWNPFKRGSAVTKQSIAEANERARLERNRLALIEDEKRRRYKERPGTRARGVLTQTGQTQPGTARSSKRFQGTQKHSRFGRGGGGFIFGEDILGSKRDWHRRRFPRKRNLSEVYRPQGMITV
jgi:hypothetical protein